MHHLTCGISSLLHYVNLILFTLFLVHLILRISPHLSHHLRSHHLSLPRPFTPDLKLISFTNPFLHSHSFSFQTDAFTDLNLYWIKWALLCLFQFLATCARLSCILSCRVHVKLSYRIVLLTVLWSIVCSVPSFKHLPAEILSELADTLEEVRFNITMCEWLGLLYWRSLLLRFWSIVKYSQADDADSQNAPGTAGSIRTRQASCSLWLFGWRFGWVVATLHTQCESTSLPEVIRFFSFFHKRLRIFNRIFAHLLHVVMYAILQMFMQLSPTLSKLCYIKRDNLVHIICAKCPKRDKTRPFKRLRKSLIALLIVVCGK